MAKIKGQAALEFMMTYGWAIIIIVVVLVVVWQMGLLNPNSTVKPTYSGFWGITPFDWNYMSNGTLVLSLQNNVGGDVNITGIDVTTGMDSDSDTTERMVPAGGIIMIDTITGLTTYNAGSSFDVFVSIEYIDGRVGRNTKFRSSGSIRGTVGAT